MAKFFIKRGDVGGDVEGGFKGGFGGDVELGPWWVPVYCEHINRKLVLKQRNVGPSGPLLLRR